MGGYWPPPDGEQELPFQRERRERGAVLAFMCESHRSAWGENWGLKHAPLSSLSFSH